MGILDKILGIAKIFRGNSKGNEETSPARNGDLGDTSKINPKDLRQVLYHKVGENGKDFVPVYAPVFKILDHELYIFRNGELRVITSPYVITDPKHLVRTPTTDVLFMYVWNKELRPLPKGRSYFDRNFDLQVRYPPATPPITKLVAEHPVVQASMTALNTAREQFTRVRDTVRNFAAGQEQYFQNLAPLVVSAEKGINAVIMKENPPEIRDEVTPVTILPAEPQTVLQVRKRSRFKKRQWAAAVDRLLRPD